MEEEVSKLDKYYYERRINNLLATIDECHTVMEKRLKQINELEEKIKSFAFVSNIVDFLGSLTKLFPTLSKLLPNDLGAVKK